MEQWVLHRLAELIPACVMGTPPMIQGVFQAIFTFATVDLSALYFDVRKDVLYCDGDTVERPRGARFGILFHRLTTAPVLVFTMEEVWLSRFGGG